MKKAGGEDQKSVVRGPQAGDGRLCPVQSPPYENPRDATREARYVAFPKKPRAAGLRYGAKKGARD